MSIFDTTLFFNWLLLEPSALVSPLYYSPNSASLHIQTDPNIYLLQNPTSTKNGRGSGGGEICTLSRPRRFPVQVPSSRVPVPPLDLSFLW